MKAKRPHIPKSVSDAVMEYWRNRCAFYGASELDRNHIILFSDNGSSTDPSNFILLCKNHHEQYHKKTPSGTTFITRSDLVDFAEESVRNNKKIRVMAQ